MRKKEHSLASQRNVSRLISIVRDALVTSVMWTPPSMPPVRFHRIHVSRVPNIMWFCSINEVTSGTLSIIHLTLSALKQLLKGNPQTAFRIFCLFLERPNRAFSVVVVRTSFHANPYKTLYSHIWSTSIYIYITTYQWHCRSACQYFDATAPSSRVDLWCPVQ